MMSSLVLPCQRGHPHLCQAREILFRSSIFDPRDTYCWSLVGQDFMQQVGCAIRITVAECDLEIGTDRLRLMEEEEQGTRIVDSHHFLSQCKAEAARCM
jgi:hypothetical protein